MMDEDEPLELTEEMEVQEPDENQDEDKHSIEEPDQEASGEETGEETVISFDGDEADQPDDNSTMRQMRQAMRDKDKLIAELQKQTAKAKPERRAKPTLESCDYDEDRFETELDVWKAEEADIAAEGERTAAAERRSNESWQHDFSAYNTRKTSLGVVDYQDAEDAVVSTLNAMQQAVIVKAASDPATLVYALGKSPAKLAELAGMDDPIKLAAAIARMEGAVKVVKRKKGPAIDTPQRGSGKTPERGDIQKQLAELEKKADETGLRTDLINFKKKHGL